jgi:hypothetical protein
VCGSENAGVTSDPAASYRLLGSNAAGSTSPAGATRSIRPSRIATSIAEPDLSLPFRTR